MLYCMRCGAVLYQGVPVVCQQCKTEFWKNPRCCAGALTEKDGKLLLVKRLKPPWAGYWDIPGGFCEDREHPEMCAVRETWEETGIKIKIQNIFGIWLDPVDHFLYGDCICIYYSAEAIETADERPDKEETALVQWFPYDQLPKEIAFGNHIPQVLKTWQDRQKTFARNCEK